MISIGDPANGKRLIFARADGSIIVVSPAAVVPPRTPEAEYIAWVALDTKRAARLTGETWPDEAEHVATVEAAEIPARWKAKRDQSGTLLVASAIRWDGSALTVDLPTARQHVLNEVAKVVAKDKLEKIAAELETLDLPALETYKPKEV